MEALLSAARARQFEAVLVDDLSRLSRDNHFLLTIYADFRFNGVRIVSRADSLDSDDHHSHMAYAVEGRCPPSHPVALPAIELILRYPEIKGPVVLSSGSIYSAHADFVKLNKPDTPVTIDGDARVPWSEIINIVNICKRDQIDKIEFAMGAGPPQ